jgi:hypothetical protein
MAPFTRWFPIRACAEAAMCTPELANVDLIHSTSRNTLSLADAFTLRGGRSGLRQ